MVFTEPPVAHSSPNKSRSRVAPPPPPRVDVVAITTNALSSKPIVSTGNNVTSFTNAVAANGVSSKTGETGLSSCHDNGSVASNGFSKADNEAIGKNTQDVASSKEVSMAAGSSNQTAAPSAGKERRKVRRNVNGVIKKPNFRRLTGHVHSHVDIIIEESPEELRSLSLIDISEKDDLKKGEDSSEKDDGFEEGNEDKQRGNAVSESDTDNGVVDECAVDVGDGSKVEKQDIGDDFENEVDRDSPPLPPPPPPLEGDWDSASLSSAVSGDITFTAEVNGLEVKFIESTGE